MKPENRNTACLLGPVSSEFYKLEKAIHYCLHLPKTYTDP